MTAEDGEVLKEIRAAGTSLQQNCATYAYTPNGQRDSIKDSNNNETLYTCDPYDRAKRTTFPDASYEEVTSYDPAGNPLPQRKRSGQVIINTYDQLNRILTKTAPSVWGNRYQTYTYDLARKTTD